jgi:NAD(P)-dependent dehydrogenase (short-subunit alcohol dehydrogenase family)/acyl carrier protein
VLLGRGEISETARTAIAALRETGVRIELPRGDVARAADVERVLATIAHEMPPLGGIVHAAGVLEDATIWRLDPATLDRVMAPKLDGAWNLHQATLGTALEFFIMLSSASVILGAPGQAGYAAANGFLDALSAHRNHRGLASLSLRLGLVAGSRMAGDGSAEQRIGTLSQDEVTQAVVPLWRSGRPAATLLRFTAADWLGRHPTAANRDFFAALLPEEILPQPDSAVLLQQLRDLDSSLAVHATICDALAEIVGAVVKLPVAEIELDRPLRDLGVDSLMTLQIRTAIAARFGCEMHVATFWSHPTIIAFARHLMTELGLADEAPAESPRPAPVHAPVESASNIRAALAAKWDKYL